MQSRTNEAKLSFQRTGCFCVVGCQQWIRQAVWVWSAAGLGARGVAMEGVKRGRGGKGAGLQKRGRARQLKKKSLLPAAGAPGLEIGTLHRRRMRLRRTVCGRHLHRAGWWAIVDARALGIVGDCPHRARTLYQHSAVPVAGAFRGMGGQPAMAGKGWHLERVLSPSTSRVVWVN